MNERALAAPNSAERTATIIFGLWLLLVLVADLLTLSSFPVPWVDEVMFADPAINLIQRGQWVSTAWFGRGDLHFWAGNSPLFSALTYGWLRLWGPAMESVRSLNYVLPMFAFALGWVAVRRLGLIQSPWTRLLVFAALTICYPISYNARCGRPDGTGLVLLFAAALAWSATQPRAASIGLGTLTALLPFSGLHYVAYMPVLLAVLWWQTGPAGLSRIKAILVGGLIGGLLFCAYHQFFAGWDGLISSMTDIRSRPGQGRWAQIINLPRTLFLRYYLIRPHFLLLFLVAGLLWLSLRQTDRSSRRFLSLATIFLIVPGIFLAVIVHFGVTYHPLAIVPAALLLAQAAELSWTKLNFFVRAMCCTALLGLGLSGRLVFVSLGWALGNEAYLRKIEAETRASVLPSDTAYGDWQIYYALKPTVREIYFHHILPRLERAEKQTITVAFLQDGQTDSTEWLSQTFEGKWKRTKVLSAPGQLPGGSGLFAGFSPWYFFGKQLTMYRREMPDVPAGAGR